MKPRNTDGKLRLALIFGGRSGEHDVSVVSARSVHRALDPDRYEVVPMAIDRAGRWADPETARLVLAESTDRADGVVDFEGRSRLDMRLVDDAFDIAFPVLHGPYGEDGTIQGLFEILDIPFVGCDTAASALCMDKIFCKNTIAHGGLTTPPWVEIDTTLWRDSRPEVEKRCAALEFPLFVMITKASQVGMQICQSVANAL